ncbi:response regulator [Silvanigrella sp.]|jgi:PleD family two-component response regulator|uniref:response regulator n=1 Tax=Silvanigrella sp. TaxID=2024976 RepID=UPI0037C6EB4D
MSTKPYLISVKNNKIILSQEIIDILIAGNDCLKKSMDIIDVEPKSELAHFNQIRDSIDKILNLGKKENSNKKTENLSPPPPIENKKSIGNVLILDDEKEILEYMKIVVEQQNYLVYVLDNAKDALDILNTKKIDVILTDLKMPKIDGFQFTEQIRKINKFIPIILVSGNLDLESSKKFLKLGVNDFIDKPFNTNNLVFVLDRAMKTRYIWNELLKISKACFKTYVYFQKMDSFINNGNVDSDILKDREILKNCLDEIKETTINILDFEKSKTS